MRRDGGRMALLVLGVAAASACAPPPVIRGDGGMREVAAHYRDFYPAAGDPDPSRDARLLRPRLGLPAIARAGDGFALEWLRRGTPAPVRAALLADGLPDAQAAACLTDVAPPRGCWPLAISVPSIESMGSEMELAHAEARPLAPPPPGAYDLLFVSTVDQAERVHRAVWLREDDPAARRAIRVAHLSDLHVGKGHGDLLDSHLRAVIADVNALHPDLVVVTGDLVNMGQDASQAPRAEGVLRSFDAPVLAVLGNHDIGFGIGPNLTARYGSGWANFARSFHPFLLFGIRLAGYEFIGFDSGPSTVSPRVLTRGLSPGTVEELRTRVEAARTAGLDVVLFSHAASRARLTTGGDPSLRGVFGRMEHGTAAFEEVMLDAAAHGQRVLHLNGHTHWSDVFEAQTPRQGGAPRFVRWPTAAMSPCLTPISGKAAIITIQSASHSGLPFKDNARGWGFAWLVLGAGDPQVAFRRYGLEPPEPACPEGTAAVPR